MFAFLSKLFGKKKKPTQARAFRPTLDALESREVMSVSSGAIHVVAPPGGPATAYYFDSKHLLAANGHELPQNLHNTPTNIQTFSAGLDGHIPDVVAKAGDGSLWLFEQGIWSKILSASNGATSFAAVDGDRVYAIFGNGSLHEFNQFDSFAWSLVPNSGTVLAIDAITDGRGNDAVFALNSNGSFGEYFGGHFDLMMAAGTRFGRFSVGVGDFTAATDSGGDAIVYGQILGKFGRERADFGLYHIGYGSETFITNNVSLFSGTRGALWITTTNGSLVKYDGTSFHTEPSPNGGFVSLSADSANDVYYVAGNTVIETQLAPVFGVTSYEDYGTVAK